MQQRAANSLDRTVRERFLFLAAEYDKLATWRAAQPPAQAESMPETAEKPDGGPDKGPPGKTN